MPAYDPQNPFAKILRGEFPCHKVYENEHVLAFLDIMPRSPGHTLVIPKAPARNIFDIAPEDYANVARAAQTIAKAAMKAFEADGITVQQFNESAGGQAVFHLHMHVMPRHMGITAAPCKPPGGREGAGRQRDQADRGVGVSTILSLASFRGARSVSPDVPHAHVGRMRLRAHRYAMLRNDGEDPTPSRNPRAAAGPAG